MSISIRTVLHTMQPVVSWDSHLEESKLHDTAWSIIKLAHVARKQDLPDTALATLNRLNEDTLHDVEDNFAKLRESICLTYNIHDLRVGGSNLISTADLQFFTPQQKSELFRLKGKFKTAVGLKQDANYAFSTAMQICGNYGKGWFTWAKYCDTIYVEQVLIMLYLHLTLHPHPQSCSRACSGGSVDRCTYNKQELCV